MFVLIIVIIFGAILFSFGFVLLFGAPYLPTMKPQMNEALDLLSLRPGQTLLDLGSGDGRILIAAAQRGLIVIGYELNPILVVISWIRTRRYRRNTKIIWGDYWRIPWPPADGVFGFILPRYMSKLHKKLMQYSFKPIKVASFAFVIPEKKPVKISKGIYLYTYNL